METIIMPLGFPNNPTLNQQAVINNKTYVWNGSAWNLVPYILPSASTSNQGSVQILDGGGINLASSGVISSIGSQLYLWANFR
jgi:hypothetical protein